MYSIIILSILEKDRSNSPFTSGVNSSPSLSSRSCSLKKLVWGGSIASISFAARVTTHLLPMLCHGTFKDSWFGLDDRSS